MKTTVKIFALSILAVLFINSFAVAQNTDDDVHFTAILQDVLNMNLLTGSSQSVTFSTADNYNNGQIVGTSTLTIESTTNWKMEVSAPDFAESGTGSAIIPIENLGVWVDATGGHTFSGGEVTSNATTSVTSQGITSTAAVLINNGSGNQGDASDNAFTLNWEMGTKHGTMESTSLFDQLSNGTIANIGTFETDVTIEISTTL